MITPLDKKNFDNFISPKGKRVVEFSASWCVPCQIIKPIIEEISDENPDLQLGLVDVDESYEIAVQYGIRSVPAFLIFEDGEAVRMNSQIGSKSYLTKVLTGTV